MEHNPRTVCVIGPGAWGTALAMQLARGGTKVHLYGPAQDEIAAMREASENTLYLPGHALVPLIHPTSDFTEAMTDVHDVMLAVPSHAFESVCTQLLPFLDQIESLLWVTKGMASKPVRWFHEVVETTLGTDLAIAMLSGPSFAKEVAHGLPTSVDLAVNDPACAARWQDLLQSARFNITTTGDFTGVQLGGVAKNVLAIAAGMNDGLMLGVNARSALMTLGFAEMRALNAALGGMEQTLLGFSGFGDLVLTCTDDQSRNRRFGVALGEGATIEATMESMGHVVEGWHNVRQLHTLASEHAVAMPVMEAVYAVLFEQADPRKALLGVLA